VVRGFVILTAGLLAACQPEAKPTPFDLTHDIDELMQEVIDPAAKSMWAHVGWRLTEEGVVAFYPQSETEWRRAANDASILAETGNLLLIPGRIRVLRDDNDKPLPSDNGDWVRYATEMTTRALEVKQATIARDNRQMFAAGAEVYKTCLACHEKYYFKDGVKMEMW
jgi:hypothetical protein